MAKTLSKHQQHSSVQPYKKSRLDSLKEEDIGSSSIGKENTYTIKMQDAN